MINPIVRKIVKRELRSYFTTPLGYVFIIIFLFAIGYVTFEPGRGSFFLIRQATLASFFKYIPWLFLFLIPAVSMRLLADERKSGTIELLLTLPLNEIHAVIGKFLASWLFVTFALVCTFPMVLTVTYLGSPDFGVIFLGYLGAILLAGSFMAIGIFFSALTKNQVISFILSVVVCYIFLMAGSPPIIEFLSSFLPRYFTDIFESLSLIRHFETMGRGVLRLSDILFFIIMIVGWLTGTCFLLKEKKAN